MDYSYEGYYAVFDTPSKKIGSMLMGPDSLVGDDLKIDFRVEENRVVAWLLNKFGAEVGFLNEDGSRKMQLANARGKKIRVLLSFVAYSDEPDPGHYWGEVAIICFNPVYSAEIDVFVNRIGRKLAEGIRPAIALRNNDVQKIFDEPNWIPTNTVALPKTKKGTAVLKDHQSMSEKIIEKGRARNKGCYAISWFFIVIMILAIAYLVAHFMGVIL